MNLLRTIVAASVLTFSSTAGDALEIVDSSRVPTWYATTSTQKGTDGKETKVVVFNRSARPLSMGELNQVLNAYGATVVDHTRAPAGYIQQVASKDGAKSYLYIAPAHGIAPESINRILAAYGLTVKDAKKLPATYGRGVMKKDKDGKDMQAVEFSRVAYAIAPVEWNQILSAYGK